MSFYTVSFEGKPFEGFALSFLNQLLLPEKEQYVSATSVEEVARIIETMVVRGAPAIGVSAAMGLALGLEKLALKHATLPAETLKAEWVKMVERLNRTRPTAVNLFWATRKMTELFETERNITPQISLKKLALVMINKAQGIHDEDVQLCRSIGKHGSALLPEHANVITHCNAGALATAGFGTALGVFRAAAESGKKIHVYCDETRPYLQGARLTAWELMKDRIPATVITDNMSAHIMKTEKIDAVVVGADRIARNGDTANKIGTYALSILCKHHGIPLYIAAPSTTFDLSLKSGNEIPIEERSHDEVSLLNGKRLTPVECAIRHPAFDVTPGSLISGIITERGVIRPVNEETVCRLMK